MNRLKMHLALIGIAALSPPAPALAQQQQQKQQQQKQVVWTQVYWEGQEEVRHAGHPWIQLAPGSSIEFFAQDEERHQISLTCLKRDSASDCDHLPGYSWPTRDEKGRILLRSGQFTLVGDNHFACSLQPGSNR